MDGENQTVPVFRSDAADAEEQAVALRDTLARSGIIAEVAQGDGDLFELRVAAAQEQEAARIVEAQPEFSGEPGDLSSDLDMVPVFSSSDYNAELLSTEVRSILAAHEIPSVVVNSTMFPSLPYEVRVPKSRYDEASKALAAAAEAGPAAAEAAEQEFEAQGGKAEP